MACAAIVGKVEARGHRAAEEGYFAVADDARALPDSGRDDELDMLTSLQVLAEGEDSRAAIGVELEHFDGVSEIEMENFVGIEDVHLGKGAGFQEIVNGGADRALAAGEIDWDGGSVSAAEKAAFLGMWLEMQEGFDFCGGHDHRC